jgi:sugar phosphate isomerase/epimerase
METGKRVEKFIQDCTRNCSNELIAVESRAGKEVISYHEWLTSDQARRAVEIAREEAAERACEYLDGLIEILNDHGHGLKKERIIGWLKQAMKDE